METWMFYSYKGGSGRTVASANIAGALAKLGKRVLVIDMDFEAPGLATVFRVQGTKQFGNRLGIVDYFRNNITLQQLENDVLIDLAAEEGLLRHFRIPRHACFLYLMASSRTAEIFSSVPDLNVKMRKLRDEIGKSRGLDYIILDSASGIREAFTLSIDACNKIMIFFRWSRQHLEGTFRVCSLMKQAKPLEDSIYRPFKLVASAVPSERDLEGLDRALANILRGGKSDSLNLLENEFGEDGKLFDEIPEIVELKWQESVIVFDRDDTPYERIANRIISL